MNQNCVPSWNNNNLEDVSHPIPSPPVRSSPPLLPSFTAHPSPASPSACPSDTSMLDYEMAELGWENGQLTMHGLGLPRVPSKSNLADATRANGMLESIVNQAYCHRDREPTQPVARINGGCEHEDEDIVPWGPTASPHVPMTLDALVPNNTVVGCSTRVGSCSEAAARASRCSDWSASASVSASESTRRKRQAEDTCEQLWSMNNNNGLASTSFAASLENTRTFTLDDHDSASQSRSQKERGEEVENQKLGTAKSTGSTKRSRAAAVHNQSERKRRDKINQRMKTLQKLVPNSNKTDKASMLDEVIEHLKNLQAQVQMLNRMSVPSMMMPLPVQHQLQMSMMAPVGLGMGMGMENVSNMGRLDMTGVSPPSFMNNMAAAYNMAFANCDKNGTSLANGGAYNMPQGTLVSADPLSAYLACHSNPMTMDAYSKMAAIYQQQTQQLQPQPQHHQQQPAGIPSSNNI